MPTSDRPSQRPLRERLQLAQRPRRLDQPLKHLLLPSKVPRQPELLRLADRVVLLQVDGPGEALVGGRGRLEGVGGVRVGEVLVEPVDEDTFCDPGDDGVGGERAGEGLGGEGVRTSRSVGECG